MKNRRFEMTDEELKEFKKFKQGQYAKMTPDELQEYLHFKKRSFIVPNKKGKGSYKRKKEKFDF
jgi:hypothetical protein